MHRLSDLHAQLPGGGEHQCSGQARLAMVGQCVDDGQCEGSGLSGAGGCLAHEVDTGEHGWNRLLLDGGGGFVAKISESGHQLLAKAQSCELAGCIKIHGRYYFLAAAFLRAGASTAER